MTMLIANPPFLTAAPPARIQAAVLAVLLWAALPMAVFLPFGVISLFVLLLTVRVVLLRTRFTKLSSWWLVLMLVIAAALVHRQLGTLVGREGGISLLLLMVMLKSYESATLRDWQVLLLSLLFLVGAGTVLNQNLLMGVWVLAALVGVSVCFALLGGMRGKAAIRFSLRSLLLTLPLAAVLFVAVPRGSEPLWRVPQPRTDQSQTGLSDTMELGSISNVVQSNELVANVVFSGRQPQQKELYWRAIIMANYDGRRWYAAPEFMSDRAQAAAHGQAGVLSYQMILRDQHGVVPVLDYLPEAPDGRAYRMEMGNVLRASRSREGLRRVHLTATAADTLFDPLSRNEQLFYRQLPRSGNPQTRALAASLAAQSDSVRTLVGHVLDYYRRNGFSYTLQPPKTVGADSIDRFMFETRQGFCEHYAQSFVVMMRSVGVSARVVTGYLGGEYHDSGKFWQIRSKNAHAWAEVWLPEERTWWRVDPTAAVSAARLDSNWQDALPEADRNRIQAAHYTGYEWLQTGQFYWQQWVVNFDRNKQTQLFDSIGLGRIQRNAVWLVLVLGVGAASLPLWLWWRREGRAESDPLQDGFMLLKSAVLADADSELAVVSARELMQIMHDNGVRNAEIERLLRQYEHWCYAAGGLPERAEQYRWLKRAKAAAKSFQTAQRRRQQQ